MDIPFDRGSLILNVAIWRFDDLLLKRPGVIENQSKPGQTLRPDAINYRSIDQQAELPAA
jgi:hypothetical protein